MGGNYNGAKQIEKLRQTYINNPPEGMTFKLVRDMTDSDLLDMHYFLVEDDDEFEEGFYIF
ncbi:hypothetical protein EAI30_17475 [Romboutsia ilealis]|uniref:hypothetical protein n=1 Tax=Faecalicatena contorta TaxID=39482 RepID=UPI00129EA998|nr:hypothetical protein [Faecalicatena contorta]MRN26388.1 hypothetical protein [Romboutsia ilealis]